MFQKRVRILLAVLLLASMVLAACGAPPTPIPPEQANVAPTTCDQFKSDNGKNYKGGDWGQSACVPIDTNLYKLKVYAIGDLRSNQTVNGQVSGGMANGYGSVSGTIWTEGKGILSVMVLSIEPKFDNLDLTKPVILKTTDLKVIGMPPGTTSIIYCNKDAEPMAPVYDGQPLTTDRLTYELDDCRMLYPQYDPNDPDAAKALATLNPPALPTATPTKKP